MELFFGPQHAFCANSIHFVDLCDFMCFEVDLRGFGLCHVLFFVDIFECCLHREWKCCLHLPLRKLTPSPRNRGVVSYTESETDHTAFVEVS